MYTFGAVQWFVSLVGWENNKYRMIISLIYQLEIVFTFGCSLWISCTCIKSIQIPFQAARIMLWVNTYSSQSEKRDYSFWNIDKHCKGFISKLISDRKPINSYIKISFSINSLNFPRAIIIIHRIFVTKSISSRFSIYKAHTDNNIYI